MSLGHSPRIVTNGLVLLLDATNTRSYPGFGISAIDISGNGKNGTLLGGTAFNPTTKAFVFDGVNDVIDFGTGNTVFPLYQISHEFIFRSFGTVPTTGTSPSLCGITYGIRLQVGTTALTASFDDGVTFPALSTSGTNNYQDGNWYHVAVTHDGLNFKIYVNGVLSNSRTSTWLGVTRWPTNNFYIGRDNNNVNYYFYGEIAVFRLYNRALSAEEVHQNCNALRGRYGI